MSKNCVLCFLWFFRVLLLCGLHNMASSIGHPPHSSASPVELRLRVGPRALSEKKELREQGVSKKGETDRNAPKENKLGVNK